MTEMDFSLSSSQQAYVNQVREFALTRVAPRAAEMDATARYPRELVAEAAALGLMGVTIGERDGGAGRDYVTYAAALEAVASASATLAVILSVNNSLVAEVVAEFGTAGQRDTWLRPLATGRAIGAFALSEEQAGSDAANQHTIARLDDRGGHVPERQESLGGEWGRPTSPSSSPRPNRTPVAGIPRF